MTVLSAFSGESLHVTCQMKPTPAQKESLFLKFMSPNQVSYFGTAENINLENETTPKRLMEEIRPLTKRLDW